MNPKVRLALLGSVLVGGVWVAMQSIQQPTPTSEPAPRASSATTTGARGLSATSSPAAATQATSAAPAAPAATSLGAPPATAEKPKKKKADRTPEEEKAAQMVQGRRVIERLYGPFLDTLRADDAKRAKLISLLVDLREAARDYAAAQAAGGVDATTDREAFDGSVNALRDSLRERIHALLGDDDYVRYLTAEKDAKKVATVDQLEKELRKTDTPLRPAQSEQFLALLRESDAPKLDAPTIDRAATFLSPAQVEVLRADLARSQLGPKKENVQRVVREGGR